jgi:hypothetical protein
MQGGGILIEYILIPVAAIPIVAWAVLWYFIKRNLEKRDAERAEKEAEVKKILAIREAEKEARIKERWAEFTGTQVEIEKKLDVIAKAVSGKMDTAVHKEMCDDHMDIIWERLDHHCHDSQGNVVIPAGSRR